MDIYCTVSEDMIIYVGYWQIHESKQDEGP